MSVKYHCDRCNKEITNYFGPVDGRYLLCKKCQKVFEKWLKEKSEDS